MFLNILCDRNLLTENAKTVICNILYFIIKKQHIHFSLRFISCTAPIVFFFVKTEPQESEIKERPLSQIVGSAVFKKVPENMSCNIRLLIINGIPPP